MLSSIPRIMPKLIRIDSLIIQNNKDKFKIRVQRLVWFLLDKFYVLTIKKFMNTGTPRIEINLSWFSWNNLSVLIFWASNKVNNGNIWYIKCNFENLAWQIFLSLYGTFHWPISGNCCKDYKVIYTEPSHRFELQRLEFWRKFCDRVQV